MVLMPYLHGITRARFPYGVALLVLINVAVFFGFQSYDSERNNALMVEYVRGPLPDIELPRYVDWLRSRTKTDKADEIEAMLKDGEQGQAQAMQHMEADKVFMSALHKDQVISPAHRDYEKWRLARASHEEAEIRVFTNRYSYDPGHPTWYTPLTHQFLHADFGHILGNMIVLCLIAPAAEALIGMRRFLGIYLASGFAALGMHLLLNPTEAGLLGASGAISGAMGAFAVLLGTRRIPFFYSVVVYFDVIRAPALLALPIWLTNELAQLYWLGDGHVAYGAHFGGLLMGALLAWPFRKRAHQRMEEVAEAQAEEPGETPAKLALVRARRLMTAQNYTTARSVYAQAAEQAGEDEEALRECLNVTALAPASDEYHRTVAPILRLTSQNAATHAFVLETFRDYVKKAQPIPRVRVSTLVILCERFTRQRNLPELERCIRLLHATAASDPRSMEAARNAARCLSESGERLRGNELMLLFRATG